MVDGVRVALPARWCSARVIGVSVYVIFYLTTVFALSWGTTALGYTREQFLIIQLFGVVFFAITVPVSALLAERGRRRDADVGQRSPSRAFGLVMAPLFEAGTAGAVATMIVGFALVGPRLRPDRHRAGRAVPHRGALHRQLAHLQPRRHRRRVAGAVHRHLAGDDARTRRGSATTCRRRRCSRSPGSTSRARPATLRCRFCARSCPTQKGSDPYSGLGSKGV